MKETTTPKAKAKKNGAASTSASANGKLVRAAGNLKSGGASMADRQLRLDAPRLEFGKKWEYAPAPESRDPVKLEKRYELFVGGKWQAPKSGKYFETISPSTEEKLADVAEANAEDVDLAVRSARNAYEKVWSKMPGSERAKYIYRIARALQEKAREFAIVESLDGGKPIKESRDVDVPLRQRPARSHLVLD